MQTTNIPEIYYSVVIPVYNSATTLEVLYQRLSACMEELEKPYEILFIEDCGQDNSWEVLCHLKKQSDKIRCFRLANNFGQWAALLCGTEQAKGKYVITIDDDLQYDEKDIIQLCQHRTKNDLLLVYGIPDYAFENNVEKTQRKFRNILVNFIFSKEISSSFRIFKRRIFVNNQGFLRSQFHLEAAENIFIAPKYKDRIPVKFRKREKGKSGYNLLKKIKLLMSYGIEYYNTPFITFSIIGFSTLFLSIFMFLLFIVRRNSVLHDHSYHLLAASIFNLGAILVAIGVLSLFLSQLFLLQKGKPIYIIAESI